MVKHDVKSNQILKQCDFLDSFNDMMKYSRWIGIPFQNVKLAVYWALTLLLSLTLLEGFAIWKLFRALTSTGSLIYRLSGSIFYANSLVSLILIWKFSNAWKKVSLFWLRAEKISRSYVVSDKHLKRRVNFVYKFVIVCACVEHAMSMMSAIGWSCPPSECFRIYILRSHGFLILSLIIYLFKLRIPFTEEYRFWMSIPIFVLSKVATILWNLQDLLIISISMGLYSRYCRLNEYAKSLIRRKNEPVKHVNSHNYRHTHLWRKLRGAYVRQADLVRALDKHLGPLILLSNINNLYFICLQLYLGIRITNMDWISRLYYVTSLTWLLFRACSVVLAAAEISVQSQQVLPLLRQCSNTAYNIEVNRLTNQLTHDKIALSGMGLFSLTRQNLLQVVAAVIKYELILLQFDK